MLHPDPATSSSTQTLSPASPRPCHPLHPAPVLCSTQTQLHPLRSAWGASHPASLGKEGRVLARSQSSGHTPAPLQGTPSPWGTPSGTPTSHPGISPGAGALCWRICGRPASTAGRSAGQRARRLLGASGSPCPHHIPASPCPHPQHPCLVLLTLLAWGQEGMLGIGICEAAMVCPHPPPVLITGLNS